MSADDSDTNLEKEWEVARDVIKTFDEQIHDLRKYGFSFITALLTAQSILIPAVGGSPSSSSIPDSVKFGVLAVTLLLVVALRVLEYTYRFYQKSAASRAVVVERQLNFELTETVANRFDWEGMRKWYTYLYYLFAVGVLGVGLFVLSLPFALFLVLLTALAGYAVHAMEKVELDFESHGPEDWTLDRRHLLGSDPLTITLTNLEKTELRLPNGKPLFRITRESDGVLVWAQDAAEDVRIGPMNNFSWQWTPSRQNLQGKVEPGIYRVFPSKWKGGQRVLWDEPLRRSVILTLTGVVHH